MKYGILIPGREMVRAYPEGSKGFYLYIICLRERLLDFQKSIGFLKFLKPSKCFIPRREMQSISNRGPIVYNYVLIFG